MPICKVPNLKNQNFICCLLWPYSKCDTDGQCTFSHKMAPACFDSAWRKKSMIWGGGGRGGDKTKGALEGCLIIIQVCVDFTLQGHNEHFNEGFHQPNSHQLQQNTKCLCVGTWILQVGAWRHKSICPKWRESTLVLHHPTDTGLSRPILRLIFKS